MLSAMIKKNKLALQMDAYQKGIQKALEEGNVVDPNTIIPLDENIKNPTPEQENLEVFRKMLLEGIPNVSIRKNTEPESGFFAVMDFTKLKGKKYNDKVIENDFDMLEYFYIKGKIVYIMGRSVSWPNEDEIIGRINFALTKKALINNMKILTISVRGLE